MTVPNDGVVVGGSPKKTRHLVALGLAIGSVFAFFIPEALLAVQAAGSSPGVVSVLGISPRKTIWVVAQLHLLFAAFVVGVPVFTVVVEFIGWKTGDLRYDRLAREFIRLLTVAFATTAALGGALAFTLFGLYPAFSGYFISIFTPSLFIYVAFFFLETAILYSYYFSWDALMNRKGLHLTLGVMLNLAGTVLIFIGSSWTAYMMAPTGIDETGAFVGTTWQAVNNPLWIPLTIHRVLGNVAFGGFVVGAYAAVKFLSSTSEARRAHYDWMGYVGNFIGLAALIPLPFAGYLIGREIYATSAVMGNNMMGGSFSWIFILQAMTVGLQFMIGNYYLWSGMNRIPGAERYQKYIKYFNMVLILCVAVWLTPRNLPLSAEEQLALGGQIHPILGYLGLMAAKNAVINFIIITTFASFLFYRRGNKTDLVPVSEQGGGAAMVLWVTALTCTLILGWYASVLFNLTPESLGLSPERAIYIRLPGYLLVGSIFGVVLSVVLTLRDRGHLAQLITVGFVALNSVFVLGIYSFVVMTAANPLLRQVAAVQWIVLMCGLILVTAIDVILFRGARSLGPIRWGQATRRSQYALVALCVNTVFTMGIMAFVRSGLREDWHIYGVMRDTSEWAFTPTTATMTQMVGVIAIVFLAMVSFLFWLSGLDDPDIGDSPPPSGL